MLRYPRARLALFNRLLVKNDCVQAFAETAQECGLVCPDDLSKVDYSVTQLACGCMTAARLVLKATMPEAHEELWLQLVNSVEKYKQQMKLEHCLGWHQDQTAIGCAGMAPVVLDLLLQTIMPYPRQ